MQLDTLLQALLSNDNSARQQAEREFKKLAKQPEACSKLLEAAGVSQSPQVGVPPSTPPPPPPPPPVSSQQYFGLFLQEFNGNSQWLM